MDHNNGVNQFAAIANQISAPPTTTVEYQSGGGCGNVEDITNRLDRMDVSPMDVQNADTQLAGTDVTLNLYHGLASDNSTPRWNTFSKLETGNQQFTTGCQDNVVGVDQQVLFENQPFRATTCNTSIETQQQQQQHHHQQINGTGSVEQQYDDVSRKKRENMSNILIVTNLDTAVFNDRLVKTKFESLFSLYDENVTFRYLKSFRRVRLDFSDAALANAARTNLDNYRLGNCQFRCYLAQIIRPNSNSLEDQDSLDYSNQTTTYLNIPKPTKQFLISPPASPPVGWEPVNESSPCIDVQLISALSNLVPGKVHEIHAGNESQPGIFVEVCEEAQFESPQAVTRRGQPRIPRTTCPMATSPGAQSTCFQMTP